MRLKILVALLVVAIAGAGYTWWRSRTGAGGDGITRHIPARGLTFPATLDRLPYRAQPVFDGAAFRRPLYLTSARDGSSRIFVVEQDGRIVTVSRTGGRATTTPFLDLTGRVRRVHMEEGLLGLAFPPDFRSSRVFYVYYSASKPRRTVLARFSLQADDAERADPASEQVLLEIGQPYGNHNGGMIEFGPDGMLYVAVGDGGSGGDPHDHGQNKNTLLGSMLRLDVSG
ncbi:MAG: PQQ-dependent sugar dehydrogenase, partial [Planctomycetota bacterium]|nr:PQQ-dependent sugar dehydrogenase [Planctomycetota bacterium]